MRDVYEDMLLDGVRPIRNTFHTLITGCMKGQRLQDAMYFFDEMKAMGLQPDVSAVFLALLMLTVFLFYWGRQMFLVYELIVFAVVTR